MSTRQTFKGTLERTIRVRNLESNCVNQFYFELFLSKNCWSKITGANQTSLVFPLVEFFRYFENFSFEAIIVIVNKFDSEKVLESMKAQFTVIFYFKYKFYINEIALQILQCTDYTKMSK